MMILAGEQLSRRRQRTDKTSALEENHWNILIIMSPFTLCHKYYSTPMHMLFTTRVAQSCFLRKHLFFKNVDGIKNENDFLKFNFPMNPHVRRMIGLNSCIIMYLFLIVSKCNFFGL